MTRKTGIGVLALQGDFEAHRKALARCGVDASEVKLPEALSGLAGLVIPGGESTTLLRLLKEYGFEEALPRFVAAGGAVFGTCAGAILLARTVSSPSQWSFGLMDIDVERNGFGRQIESFETRLNDVAAELLERPDGAGGAACAVPAPSADPAGHGPPSMHAAGADLSRAREDAFDATALPAVFIRAPRIRRTGPAAAVLARLDGEPVLVREGRLMAATFHPELTADTRVHAYFVGLARERAAIISPA